MSIAQNHVIDEINELYAEASRELLEVYGLSCLPQAAPSKDANLCSVLSATGDCIKLVSVLQPEVRLLTALYPGDSSTLTAEQTEDWCAEINNQLVGRLKNKLLDRGCEVNLGLPSIVVGKELTSAKPRDASVRELHFGTRDGSLWAYHQVQIDPEFVLLPLGANSTATSGLMREGELSLF